MDLRLYNISMTLLQVHGPFLAGGPVCSDSLSLLVQGDHGDLAAVR